MNIDFDAAVDLVGAEAADAGPASSRLALYHRAAERAAAAGFVLADTKFELGYVDGVLALCDEVVTPDSSRLWPADQVVPGTTPPAFDKQPLRDWARRPGLGQAPAAAAAAARGGGGHLGALRGRLRAGHRAALADWYGARAMRFAARVEVRLRPGHRRSRGRHHRAGPAGPRLRRGPHGAGRPVVPLRARGRRRGGGPRPGRGAGPPAAGQPGHRGEHLELEALGPDGVGSDDSAEAAAG